MSVNDAVQLRVVAHGVEVVLESVPLGVYTLTVHLGGEQTARGEVIAQGDSVEVRF